jgi:hypothetical protein
LKEHTAFLSLPPASAGLFILLFGPEDRGDMFLQNVWLSPNYIALHPQLFTDHCHGNLKSDDGDHYFIINLTLLSFLISRGKSNISSLIV